MLIFINGFLYKMVRNIVGTMLKVGEHKIELKELKKFNNVISIGIIRKDYISTLSLEQQKDITETALNDFHEYDFEIENTTQTDLQKVAKELEKKIKERRNYHE